MKSVNGPASLLFLAVVGFAWAGGVGRAQIPTCPGQGPALNLSGGRLGDGWTLSLSGPPAATALIGVDAAAGTVPTPFGTVCLGLTGALATTPVSLDATGSFATGGVLPLAATGLNGTNAFVQALVAHPSLPSGYAFTNSWAAAFRPPLISIFQPTTYPPLLFGRYVTIDPITDSVTLNQTIPVTIGAPWVERVPRLGWFAFRTPAGELCCIDDFTSATTALIPGVWPGGQYIGPYQTLAVSTDGSIAFTSAWQVTYYPIVTATALPSGTVASSIGVPAVLGIYPVPSTFLAYVGGVDRFYVIDGSTGATVTTLILPSLRTLDARPVFFGNLLYVQTSVGLVAIDVTTHAVVLGPVPIGQINPKLVTSGPGTASPTSLFAFAGDATSGYSLIECSPASLTVQNVIPLPGYPARMELSAGATEWLLEVTPAGLSQPELHVLNVITGQYTPFIPAIVAGSATVLRSNTLRKAYVLSTASGGLIGFPTDPVGVSAVPIPLPVASPNLRVFSN